MAYIFTDYVNNLELIAAISSLILSWMVVIVGAKIRQHMLNKTND